MYHNMSSLSRLNQCWTQHTHDAIMTSFLHENDAATSFSRTNDVIIASCVGWAECLLSCCILIHAMSGMCPLRKSLIINDLQCLSGSTSVSFELNLLLKEVFEICFYRVILSHTSVRATQCSCLLKGRFHWPLCAKNSPTCSRADFQA